MVFSAPAFLFLFLPLVLAAHSLLPRAWRNAALLLASLAFYACGEGALVGLMLGSIAANYVFGLAVDRAHGTPRAKRLLVLAVAFNLGLLVAFKYTGFVWENVGALAALFGGQPIECAPIRLPIGISFFTFQALSYVVDVYRRQVQVERRPVDLALYVSLFPQLIAGPIVRYRDLREQLHTRVLSRPAMAKGIRRFTLGLGKKVLIANTLAVPADAIFAIPGGDLTAPVAWFGVVCYALQIYFDFSGYSDMAIGLGLMFGFRFLDNFRYPYAARSMTEFWRRWHISLSTWFRDYVYIPLGGNRGGTTRTLRNLVVVFLLCGLWHGASWNFVLWGALHGALLTSERFGLGRWLERRAVIGHAFVVLAVLVSWVPFRTETMVDAGTYLASMLGLGTGDGWRFHLAMYTEPRVMTAVLAGVIGATPWLPRVNRALAEIAPLAPVRLALVLGVLLASVTTLAASTHDPFLYFRF